jgi:hypothetical protein
MSQSVNVNDLFQTAGQDGLLSPGSVHALTTDPDLGAKIQAAFGGTLQTVGSDEVILLGILADDSGSIQYAGNTQAIIDGYNSVLGAFKKSKQRDNVFIHGKLLNGKIINPFMLLDVAPELDTKNYDEMTFSGTPLYDASFDFLGAMLAAAEDYRQRLSIGARTITLIVTDGRDEHSRAHRDPKKLHQLITDMNESEDHIVAGMGVKHTSTDYNTVFGQEMGIDPRWIMTPKSDPSDIRKAFQVFSLTAVRLSQSAALFSQTKNQGFGSQANFGGFGNP